MDDTTKPPPEGLPTTTPINTPVPTASPPTLEPPIVSSTPPVKSHKKLYLIISTIAIILLAAGIGAWFWLDSRDNDSPSNNIVNGNGDDPDNGGGSNTGGGPDIENHGWYTLTKTADSTIFTSTALRISFNFPNSWTVSDVTTGAGHSHLEIRRPDGIEISYSEYPDGFWGGGTCADEEEFIFDYSPKRPTSIPGFNVVLATEPEREPFLIVLPSEMTDTPYLTCPGNIYSYLFSPHPDTHVSFGSGIQDGLPTDIHITNEIISILASLRKN
ncbi:hypothetical protein FWH13_01100 [Candidatus Saccharibacteria bacterium]|nr:hypothetical protein [Candidatus Saccharibacteria bacterium]